MTPNPTEVQMKLAREYACQAVEVYGEGDAREHDAAVLRTLWNDHPAVQSALLAIQATEARDQALVEWQDISTAPVDEEILAAVTVRGGGTEWVERRVICIDSETGEIEDSDYDHGWAASDYEFWTPLPSPPAKHSQHGGERER